MRILIASPGHSHSTIDVSIGYENALRQLGHVVSVFHYENRLAFYDEALHHWQGLNPEFQRRSGDALVLASEPLVIEAVDFVPDVVLLVCGLALHRRAFDLLHRLDLPVVLLLTESPYADEIQAEVINKGHVAAVLTNDRASVQPLQAATGKRVCYLPHSYDLLRHYPQRVGPAYRSDVYFFGTWWPERRAMFEPLAAAQKPGSGRVFDIGGVKPIAETPEGLTDNGELCRRYAGTKIAINHHRTIIGVEPGEAAIHIQVGDAWSLGPRAYEIAACGAFQLCDDTRPELAEVFGDSVATYQDGEDLVEKVNYYLGHEDERRAMAAESRARVQACSFIERAESIVIPLLDEVR